MKKPVSAYDLVCTVLAIQEVSKDMTDYKPEGILIDTPENRAAIRNLSSLTEAMQNERILEARAVICDSEHNLIVPLGNGIRGIIPRTEGALGIAEGTTRDIAIISRVNKPVCFTDRKSVV